MENHPAAAVVKAATYLATDRVHVLREAIMSCRKAGTISVPGVYASTRLSSASRVRPKHNLDDAVFLVAEFFVHRGRVLQTRWVGQ